MWLSSALASAIVGLIFVLPPSALAIPVTFGFRGTVTGGGITGIFVDELTLGERARGHFIFDPELETHDTSPSRYTDVLVSAHVFLESGNEISIIAGPEDGSRSSQNHITIWNDDLQGFDRYQATVVTRAPSAARFNGSPMFEGRFSVVMDDRDGTVFGDSSIPLEPPPLSEMELVRVFPVVTANDLESGLLAQIDLEWIAVLPEPRGMGIVALGAALLARRGGWGPRTRPNRCG